MAWCLPAQSTKRKQSFSVICTNRSRYGQHLPKVVYLKGIYFSALFDQSSFPESCQCPLSASAFELAAMNQTWYIQVEAVNLVNPGAFSNFVVNALLVDICNGMLRGCFFTPSNNPISVCAGHGTYQEQQSSDGSCMCDVGWGSGVCYPAVTSQTPCCTNAETNALSYKLPMFKPFG